MSASANVAPADRQASGAEPQDILDEIIHGVHANGDALFQQLELLKRIIQLLLPKAASDGPTLSELLAAVLATTRELLLVERSNASGIDEILQRLEAAGIGLPESHDRPSDRT